MKNISVFIIVASSVFGPSVYAACSNGQYKVYKAYDKFLAENPSTPDHELRMIFAKRKNMNPADLKNLYMNCLLRWAEENPKEVGQHVDKMLKK